MTPRRYENAVSQTSTLNFTKTVLASLTAATAGRRASYGDSKTRGLVLLVTAAVPQRPTSAAS